MAAVLLTAKAPVFEVFRDPAKAALAETGRAVGSWSFKIDGQESLVWCPTQHAAERIVSRLKAGCSSEAFGGAGVASVGGRAVTVEGGSRKKGRGHVERSAEDVVTQVVTTKGGRTKPRETRPGYVYTLDGGEPVHAVSEQEAKFLCAVEAYRTRGKLRPAMHREAEAAFREQFKKDCKVHLFDRKLVAKDEDGLLHLVYHDKDGSGDWVFKPLAEVN